MQQEELQKKIEEYQNLQDQLQGLSQVISETKTTIEEMNETIESIKELKSSETGDSVLFPIGSGVYVSGSIEKDSEVSVSIGADVLSQKRLDDAVDFIKERKQDKKDDLEELKERKEEITDKVRRLGSEIQQAQAQAQKQAQ